jgi:enamine deaminase RidA (YjgF/YER057c/UK114 family)
MAKSRDTLFEEKAKELGVAFEGEIRAGANYEVAVENDGQIYVSGQIPRVDGKIVVTGAVGKDASLDDGRRAAAVCVLRALAVLRQSLGSLERVKKILRVTVFVRSAPDFAQQSEVADAASELLYSIFFPSGGHTRTSVGVYQLPKNAAVEIDLTAAIHRNETETPSWQPRSEM